MQPNAVLLSFVDLRTLKISLVEIIYPFVFFVQGDLWNNRELLWVLTLQKLFRQTLHLIRHGETQRTGRKQVSNKRVIWLVKNIIFAAF